jgi:GNAT superfamily N-acetyltransferase
MKPPTARTRRLRSLGDREIHALAEVLTDCVEGGASVSFMLPITRTKAETFWREIAVSVDRGDRVLIVAEDASGAIVGTVQLIWAWAENQPHRGEIAKMLVHRQARRQGIGAALLSAAERCALEAGKTLLVLDTASGDAARLYARQGWQPVGVIPEYALLPQGGFCSTTIYFKKLAYDAAPGS